MPKCKDCGKEYGTNEPHNPYTCSAYDQWGNKLKKKAPTDTNAKIKELEAEIKKLKKQA